MKSVDKISNINGYWKDTLIYDDHVEETGYRKNKILNSGRMILAGQIFGDQNITPIAYIAQGQGNSSWDNSVPEADPSQKRLVAELDRREPDEIVYLDGQNSVSVNPTNKIRITKVYPKNDPLNGEVIREEGMFGGTNATQDLNTGQLFNVFNHKKIEKTSDFKLKRQLIIEFVEAV
jgi:hypothetical protein